MLLINKMEDKFNVNDLKTIVEKDYFYPEQVDEDLQYKLYKKREFYFNRTPDRPEIVDYIDIKNYRDDMCGKDFQLQPYQNILPTFINPETPYMGQLVNYGTGAGKCIYKSSIVFINGKHNTIQNIWNKYKTNIILDNGEWSIPSSPLVIMAYNEKNNKFDNTRIKLLYRQKINEYMKKITFNDKTSIIITQIHKLFVNNYWSNKFKINDYVKSYDSEKIISNIEYILINDYVYDFETEEHNYIANGILCHNTAGGISVAELFKPQVQKYNTKIYVLVSGPILKENWLNEILKSTGDTYIKSKQIILDPVEKQRVLRQSKKNILQYYKFMSYKSFYKHVLGEKVIEKKITKDNKTKTIYKKTEEGVFERDIPIDRLYSLDNTLLIVDEAHNLTGNVYGKALMEIKKKSSNLRILLLTATPAKNLADDIVELINFIRPLNSPMERDVIFTNQKNHLMDIKEGGLEYFKKMASGYVSHVRGSDPLTFAKRIDMGIVTKNLIFTKIIPTKMKELQLEAYNKSIRDTQDLLDKSSEAASNFAFPILENNKIIATYGIEGLLKLKAQIKNNFNLINKKLNEKFNKNNQKEKKFVVINNGMLSGKIFNKKYLDNFSIKFATALDNVNQLVYDKKGVKTAFIYSNLVKVGIELFQEALLQNGYLMYQENEMDYKIQPNTICYYCGKKNKNHIKENHEFFPATFITIIGASSEEEIEFVSEDKQKILENVFNNLNNITGKHIKFVLGSRKIAEGISLKNIGEIHILDVHFTLGRVDQVTGRGIRHCSHYMTMSEKNKFPEVKVYKYCVVLENGISSEEELYRKAELKHLLVKKIERAMQEVAIDCPLNFNVNVFPEEIKEHKNCIPGKTCPEVCNYTKCDYKCYNTKLNAEFYDNERKLYQKIPKNMLDYSTFKYGYLKTEINHVKSLINNMFIRHYFYTIDDIIEYVKYIYEKEKKDLFDEFFVFKALDEMIPSSQNDFNSFKDFIMDKFNKLGYILYVNKYYVFQPINKKTDIPMVYRMMPEKLTVNTLTLKNYIKNNDKFATQKQKLFKNQTQNIIKTKEYDFDSVMDYYNNREEFAYVGIIDKDPKTGNDIFKIRKKREKILEKKRGTGISTLKGNLCTTTKNKNYLLNIAKKLNINIKNKISKTNMCSIIKNKMLELEKYSIGDKKMTYIMIPKDNLNYIFPYNLEDRVEYIINLMEKNIDIKLNISVTNKEHKNYNIIIKNDLTKYKDFLMKFNANVNDKETIINIS